MKKNLSALLLCALLPVTAYAADTELRLQQLETRITQLQNRVALLERLLRQDNAGIGGKNVYVCRLSAFTKTYEGESANQGMAKRQAQRACLREQQPLFCPVEQIECERY